MRMWLAGVLGLAIALALVGCAVRPGREQPTSGGTTVSEVDSDDWVIVKFQGQENSDGDLMDALLETEIAADRALQDAGIGSIDGNEVGDGGYEIYFVGQDREAMWAILRPIVDQAPIPWSTAELRQGLDDKSPQVVTPR